MQVEGTAGGPREAGSVRGLGVCDVLRVELAAVQRRGLEERIAARVAELERRERGEEATQALRVLAQVRAGLASRDASPLILTGPAGVVLALVDACVADAITRVAAALDGAPPRSPRLTDQLEAAAAWIGTALDCAAVDAFCFDPGVDPAHAS
jgi:hypothetical protein